MVGLRQFECVIVGAGIVGLAHALAAARNGLRTLVLDRDARSVGASVRNFGFVTISGQAEGLTWQRALRSRDVWREIADAAGIVVHQHGLLMCARRPEALRVLEEFAAGPMGRGCDVLGPAQLARWRHALRPDLAGALFSPHEIRVESRDAIPRLTAWLVEQHDVTVLPQTDVHGVATGWVDTSRGRFLAEHIIVCPGTNLVTLFPDVIARRGIRLCKLHMLRVAAPGFSLPASIMSDLGLLRYLGYAGCASLPRLAARLASEQAAALAHGIHLIAVQGADGSLVVGDSHHFDDAAEPFQPRAVDDLILQELAAVLAIDAPDIVERWVGHYPSGSDIAFTDTPMPGVRLVMVTSGTGASTAFAIGEETLIDLLGIAATPRAEDARTAQ